MAPQDLEQVVSHIAAHIWDQVAGGQPIPFIIAGSYAAAEMAYRRREGCLVLDYNDIDVFYESLDDEKDCTNQFQIHYEKDVFPERPSLELNVVRVGSLSLRRLIDDEFDINAVQVGHQIVPTISKDGTLAAKLAKTYASPAFHEFLVMQTLTITSPRHWKPSNLIRLLYKAQQLGLPYDLPPEKQLMRVFHGRCFGPRNYRKLQQLEGQFSEEVLSRIPVVWNDSASSYAEERTMYKLVLRGDASTVKRVLPNKSLDLFGLDRYDCGSFEPEDMQSPSSQATTAGSWELVRY
mmetsp:Transcript_44336/g.103618  ORF Transcript_44336/g.103618 Transcript_44336/m.103618 type:complete len:293 (+) Transcript_44336:45-923(+)